MVLKNRSHNFLSLGLGMFLSILIFSCQDKPSFEKIESLNGSWQPKKEVSFTYRPERDELSQIDVFFRHNEEYPYSNVRFFVSMSENGKALRKDTLNFYIAEPNGKWLGNGYGKTKEIYLNYLPKYTFKSGKNYTFKVQQAVRGSVLKGTEDIGISILPIEK